MLYTKTHCTEWRITPVTFKQWLCWTQVYQTSKQLDWWILNGPFCRSVSYILQKHRLLLCSVLRRLTFRRVGMAALACMRLSRKKSSLQELREQHTLQKGSSLCQDEDQWQLQKAVVGTVSQCPRGLSPEPSHTVIFVIRSSHGRSKPPKTPKKFKLQGEGKIFPVKNAHTTGIGGPWVCLL